MSSHITIGMLVNSQLLASERHQLDGLVEFKDVEWLRRNEVQQTFLSELGIF